MYGELGLVLHTPNIARTSTIIITIIRVCTQVWRPLRGPVHDDPLAMIDAATVAKQDLIPYSLMFPGRKGYNYAAQHNPDHRQASSVQQPGYSLIFSTIC